MQRVTRDELNMSENRLKKFIKKELQEQLGKLSLENEKSKLSLGDGPITVKGKQEPDDSKILKPFLPSSMQDRITPKYETPESFKRLKEFFTKAEQRKKNKKSEEYYEKEFKNFEVFEGTNIDFVDNIIEEYYISGNLSWAPKIISFNLEKYGKISDFLQDIKLLGDTFNIEDLKKKWEKNNEKNRKN